MKNGLGRIFNKAVAGHFLFWSWNAIFIAVVCFGLVPTGLWVLIREAADGFVPASFVGAALLIILIPIAATTLGLVAFRSEPKKLVELFYGFEAPLFVLALSRLFLVRQLTPALGFVLALLGIGCAAFLHGIYSREPPTNPVLLSIRYAGQIVGLGCALYLGSLLVFYALPAGAALLKWAFSGSFWRELWHVLTRSQSGLLTLLLDVGGLLLFLYSATLFVALPFAYLVLHARRFQAGHAHFAARFGPRHPRLATVFALLLLSGMAGALHLLNRQPQEHAFSLLERTPRSDAERRALLDESAAVRAGLLNAYLRDYRYLGNVGGRGVIESMYKDVFGLTREHAEAAQDLYDIFALPVLYRGDHQDRGGGEESKAAKLYEGFFDERIQKGEKDTILDALEATYQASAREAGLLDTGGRKVHLDAQEVTVKEKDGFAEVEVHEVYANRTQDEQEVFYFFSLPPTAVVTGLWLGDDERPAGRFAYSVSPRGAAQKVYQQQVARRVDPALLEQVGPRQYRLRAFPVPPRGADWAKAERLPAAGGAPKELHLWFTYQVLPEGGEWPLPSLSEKRNVYWDGKTRRTVNGARQGNHEDRWLPESVKVQSPARPRLHVVSFAGGETVRMEPLDDIGDVGGAASAPSSLPSGKAYAIVLDRSHSMARHARAVNETMAWLAASIFKKNDVDLYLTSSAARGEPPSRIDDPNAFDAAQVVYFGGQNPGDLLRQFEALRAGKKYDATIVLTDAGSLDLATDAPAPETMDEAAPLWMLHLGGSLPAGYDDATLAAIQKSGGGATTRIEDVYAHLALAEQNSGFIDLGGGYLFRLVPAAPAVRGAVTPPPAIAANSDDPLAAFAARAWVGAQVKTIKRAKNPVDLDSLHAMAKAHHFVSPYSSMIVLVNDAQRAALAKAESESDRFDREVESGMKTLPGAHGFVGSFGGLEGTPEPGEWALLGVVVMGMMFVWRERRRQWVGGAAGCRRPS